MTDHDILHYRGITPKAISMQINPIALHLLETKKTIYLDINKLKMNKKKSPLKTLFVLPELEAGGAQRVLINLMNNVNRAEFEPEFLSVRLDGRLKDLIEIGRAHV